MKRDMDLVRRIALAVNELPFGESLDSLEDVSPEAFGMHAIWMEEAGLIDAAITEYQSGEAPDAHIFRLTWAGADFADAVQSDTLWAKAKTSVLKPGISFTFDVLKDWLKAEISQGLPTIRGLAQ